MPRKGQVVSEETKERQRLAALNRKTKVSEETRKKISENSKAMHAARSTEQKQKVIEVILETRAKNDSDTKISAVNKIRCANQTLEQKAKIAAKTKASYTEEKRKAQSNKMKAIRAAETSEQKRRRGELIGAKIRNNPDHGRKISETRNSNPEKYIDLAKQAWDTRSEESKLKNMDNFVNCNSPEARAKAVATKAPYRHEINSKIASSVQDDWANMPLDVKIARVKAALGIPVRDFVMVDGSIQMFRSSWEADLANVLISLGIDYLMEVPYEFGGILYLPDFYLPEYDCIIEVKGHPKAWERWNDKVLPAIQQDWNVPTSIYILGKSIKKQIFGSFSELQKQLDFVV
jgi:hypothetical protein